MKQLDWRTFLVGLAFISSTVFAMDTFYGDLGESDWSFDTDVLIDGVELPENMEDTIGTSSVEVLGTGTLTVGNRTAGVNKLNVKVFGGTTIQSTRRWEEEDAKTWFEGVLPAPDEGRKPSYSKVSFEDTGRHPNSSVHVLSAFGIGLPNETFTFSTAAVFTFPAEIPDGRKLWMAIKEDVTPATNDDAEWSIAEGGFCVVENGLCQIELEEFNEVAFIEEYFQKCPRTSSSDTDVVNGTISGPPECWITCDRGYDLDYETMKCVAKEGTVVVPPTEQFKFESASGVADYDVNPKFHRYVGEARARVLEETEEAPVVETKKDEGFMEYLLQVRNYFGSGSSDNVFRSAEAEIDSEAELDGEVYSSAPLLPSTGPGIFLGLAVLGLGCMVVGAKGRRK